MENQIDPLQAQMHFMQIEPTIAHAVESKYASPSDNDPDTVQKAAELCVKALHDIASIAAQEDGSEGKLIEIATPDINSNDRYVEIWITFPALGDYKPSSWDPFITSGPLVLIAGALETAMGNTLPKLQRKPTAMAFGYAIRIGFTFVKAEQQ